MNLDDFSKFFPVTIFMLQWHTGNALLPLERWILSNLEKPRWAYAELYVVADSGKIEWREAEIKE